MKVSVCTGLASMRKMCRGAEMVSHEGDTRPCTHAKALKPAIAASDQLQVLCAGCC